MTPEPLSAGLMTMLRLFVRSWRSWRSSKARFLDFDCKVGRLLRAAVLAVTKLARGGLGALEGPNSRGDEIFDERNLRPHSNL